VAELNGDRVEDRPAGDGVGMHQHRHRIPSPVRTEMDAAAGHAEVLPGSEHRWIGPLHRLGLLLRRRRPHHQCEGGEQDEQADEATRDARCLASLGGFSQGHDGSLLGEELRLAAYPRNRFALVTVADSMERHPQPLALDHVVVAVPDLDAAAAELERAGFYVTARSDHPFGTSNRLVMLDGTYVELVAVTRPESVTESGFARFIQDSLAAGRAGPLLFAFRSD